MATVLASGEKVWRQCEPDQLFEKYTVSEMKKFYQQLMLDIDAKQEELRLMVGERYRDLLQASTSILSMNQSSTHVISALAELHDICGLVTHSSIPSRVPTICRDTELESLQVLASHVKLLLDAPEYLWRFLERKHFLYASWLYLLSRVVYRALAASDIQENNNSHIGGIDILSEFPLIERQWESISQFRSQIIHRVTLALRDKNADSLVTTSLLLSLHFLDNIPLAEALRIYTQQRSKLLGETLSSFTNNHDSSEHPRSPINKLEGLDDAQKCLFEARAIILNTIKIVSDVLGSNSSAPGLLIKCLMEVQSDTRSTALPVPSTEAILNSLPSSTYLLMLPPSIRSYRPVFDLVSSSHSITLDEQRPHLSSWLTDALRIAETRLTALCLNLSSIQEIWHLHRHLLFDGDLPPAINDLYLEPSKQWNALLTRVITSRTVNLWKDQLGRLSEYFSNTLEAALDAEVLNLNEVIHIDFLLESLPTSQDISPSRGIHDHLKQTLRQRLDMRSPNLKSVLSTVESRCALLKTEVDTIDRQFLGKLFQQYQCDAANVARDIFKTLDTKVAADILLVTTPTLCISSSSKTNLRIATFSGLLARNLATSSSFLTHLQCSSSDEQELRGLLHTVHAKSLAMWRSQSIIHGAACLKTSIATHDAAASLSRSKSTGFTLPAFPSDSVLRCCRDFFLGVHGLGISRIDTNVMALVHDTFASIITEGLRDNDKRRPIWGRETAQLIFDLRFLNRLLSSASHALDAVKAGASRSVDAYLNRLKLELQSKEWQTIDDQVQSLLERSIASCCTHFSPLGSSPMLERDEERTYRGELLLTDGITKTGTMLEPVIELAQSSARIGLIHITR